MTDRILLCTVGGSRDPILRAIEAYRPDFVVFVCSSGPRSSRSEVEGTAGQDGLVAQAKLPEKSWDIIEVPPDDPDQVFSVIEAKIEELRNRHPTAKIIVDYTGGTKSMSLGAGLAAVISDVQLSLVTGERPDLKQVAPGTERAIRIHFRRVEAHFALERAEEAWKRYAYGEAAALLHEADRNLTVTGEKTSVTRELGQRIRRLKNASRLFEAWDRFDHREALHIYRNPDYRLQNFPGMHVYGKALEILCNEERQPLILLDLWHNAQRCAHRQRFDDALARLYRLVEWTAQYILWSQHKLETGRFPVTEIPDSTLRDTLSRGADQQGNVKLGLFNTFQVLRERSRDHPFISVLDRPLGGVTPWQQLQVWIERRNQSILAHGFDPIDQSDWQTAYDWMQRYWLPWLQKELSDRQQDCPQFPTAFPN